MKAKVFKWRLHYLYIFADLIIAFLISFLSFLAYYGASGISEHIIATLIYCASISLFTVGVFAITRVYRMLTKDIGMLECAKIAILSGLISIVGLIAIIFIPNLPDVGKYIWVAFLAALTKMFVFASIRVVVRFFNLMLSISRKKNKVRTLVIGAGVSGKVVVDESRRNKENHNVVIAFVDDDINKIGGSFCNLPVKGPISEISTIIDYYNIEEVIIAISDVSQERLHEILGIVESCPVRVRRLPMISEMQGPNDTRIIDVDLNDLLCRDPIILDNHEVNDMLGGKTVLVTGAGGSIGSELTRQIFKTHPSTLILFDIYENGVYDIQQELRRKMRDDNIDDINLVVLIGSTYNDFRVEQIMKEYHPDYIYHAAAYKHVPLMEDSPAEEIRTNVIGTYNVARLAD